MKLLITTQTVDLDSEVLAFFHAWIIELAKYYVHVHVICLKEGRHELPANVTVHSLGKEDGESRIKYVSLFLKYVWTLRNEYDQVFVHMNTEYLVLAGWFWRLLGKPVGLWYIHPNISPYLRIVLPFVYRVFTATPKSFPIATRKLCVIGHGIDTDFFSPSRVPLAVSQTLRVMQVARIAPVKKVECAISAVELANERGTHVVMDYYGHELPRDTEYADEMRIRAREGALETWHWYGATSHDKVRDAYRAHDMHVNTTVSGSSDKTVYESMACGTITATCSVAFKDIVPDDFIFPEDDSDSLATIMTRVCAMSVDERAMLSAYMRQTIIESHSLTAFITKLHVGMSEI